jgi:hypothetical protein
MGKTHPGEDRTHRGDTLIVGLRVRNADRAGDAVDVATHDLAMAHQLDLRGVARVYERNIGLLVGRLQLNRNDAALARIVTTLYAMPLATCDRLIERIALQSSLPAL